MADRKPSVAPKENFRRRHQPVAAIRSHKVRHSGELPVSRDRIRTVLRQAGIPKVHGRAVSALRKVMHWVLAGTLEKASIVARGSQRRTVSRKDILYGRRCLGDSCMAPLVVNTKMPPLAKPTAHADKEDD